MITYSHKKLVNLSITYPPYYLLPNLLINDLAYQLPT